MTTAKRQPLILEMETADPDDFLCLLWLADHPDVDLQAVVVTPGTTDQCRLVKWALDRCGSKARLGAFNIHHTQDCVSAFHYKVYGEELRTYDPGLIEYGPKVIGDLLGGSWPSPVEFTYLAGCAPKNLGAAHRHFGELRLDRWIQQGFFAGDNVVPKEHRLPKFDGKITCPSFNPGGAPAVCLELLASDRIRRKIAVSKNVCHGVIWSHERQAEFRKRMGEDDGGNIIQVDTIAGSPVFSTERPILTRAGLRTGLRTMVYGFDCYLRDKDAGKAMHDLVAAAVALDENVCTFVDVEIYRERGEWGATTASPIRTTRISTAIDMDRFINVLAR